MSAAKKQSVPQTALTLTTAASPTTQGVRQYNPQNGIMRQLGLVWSAASGEEKSSWLALCRILSTQYSNQKATHGGAFSTFFDFNSTHMNMDAPIQTMAPAFAAATPLPAVTFTPGFVGPTPYFTLTAAANYPDKVLVYGALPTLDGATVAESKPYKLLGHIDTLGTSPVAITDLYLTPFRVPGTGYKLCLKLVGVTSDGFRSTEVCINGITQLVTP